MPESNTGSTNGRFLLGAGAFILLLTMTDFLGGTVPEVAAESSPKFSTKFMGPSIKFLYWYAFKCMHYEIDISGNLKWFKILIGIHLFKGIDE